MCMSGFVLAAEVFWLLSGEILIECDDGDVGWSGHHHAPLQRAWC